MTKPALQATSGAGFLFFGMFFESYDDIMFETNIKISGEGIGDVQNVWQKWEAVYRIGRHPLYGAVATPMKMGMRKLCFAGGILLAMIIGPSLIVVMVESGPLAVVTQEPVRGLKHVRSAVRGLWNVCEHYKAVRKIDAYRVAGGLTNALELYADHSFENACVSAAEGRGAFVGYILWGDYAKRRVVKKVIEVARDYSLTNSYGGPFDGGENVVFLALPRSE